MKMTLPARLGMSVSGLKALDVIASVWWSCKVGMGVILLGYDCTEQPY
jgi:hypothetical protein